MNCINLAQRFGSRFRIGYEDGYDAYHVPHRCRDPWMMLIPCRRGHIGPWGEDRLVACTGRRGPIVARLLAITGAALEQDGTDGVNVSFPASELSTVADLMGARKRRRLSEAQRERLRAHWFQSIARSQ